MSTINPDVTEADPDLDFTYKSDGSDGDRPYVTFPNGVTSVPISFTIIDDDIPELNEIFHVNLTDAYLVEKSPGIINFIPPSIGNYFDFADSYSSSCRCNITIIVFFIFFFRFR